MGARFPKIRLHLNFSKLTTQDRKFPATLESWFNCQTSSFKQRIRSRAWRARDGWLMKRLIHHQLISVLRFFLQDLFVLYRWIPPWSSNLIDEFANATNLKKSLIWLDSVHSHVYVCSISTSVLIHFELYIGDSRRASFLATDVYSPCFFVFNSLLCRCLSVSQSVAWFATSEHDFLLNWHAIFNGEQLKGCLSKTHEGMPRPRLGIRSPVPPRQVRRHISELLTKAKADFREHFGTQLERVVRPSTKSIKKYG